MQQILPALFLIFSFVYAAKSQSITLQPAFTAITVADIDTSIQWYSNVLHLQLRNRTDNLERGVKQAVLHNSETMIELLEFETGISVDTLLGKFPPGAQALGFFKFGFYVTDISKTHDELAEKKVQFVGRIVTDPIDKRKTFLIADPDGHLIQFFEK